MSTWAAAEFPTVSCCLLCTEQVEVEVQDKDVSPKTPNPGSGSGSSSSSSSPAKLISHEQCSFVLFQHVLLGRARDLPPPNICNNQIKLCKNESESLVKFCKSCLTQLTHVHDLVAQLARVERELEEQRAEIVLKFSSSSKVIDPPPDSATSATAAAGLPESERQEFTELRNAISGGLKLLKPQSILAIVQNLNKRMRKSPTLPPAHAQAQLNFPPQVYNSKSKTSSVRLMKNVSIPRIKLRTRSAHKPDADDADDLAPTLVTAAASKSPTAFQTGMKSKIPAASAVATQQKFPPSMTAQGHPTAPAQPSPSFPTDPLGDEPEFGFHVGAQVEGAEPEEAEHAHAHAQTVQAPPHDHVEMAYLCGVCGAIFKDHESLKLHDEGHRHDDDDARNLIRAYFTSTGTGTMTTLPPPANNDPKTRTGQQSEPQKKLTHKCTWCPAKFGRKWDMKYHVLRVHSHTRGAKPFQCALCPVKFSRDYHLQTHLRVHTGEKPFQCSLCPAKFRTKWSINCHMSVHSADKPFQCTHAQCPATFTQARNLKRHLLVHSGVKPFQCPTCSKAFKRKVHWRQHLIRMHVHAEEGPGPGQDAQMTQTTQPHIGAQPKKPIWESKPAKPTPRPPGNILAMASASPATESYDHGRHGVVILEEKFVPDLDLNTLDEDEDHRVELERRPLDGFS